MRGKQGITYEIQEALVLTVPHLCLVKTLLC